MGRESGRRSENGSRDAGERHGGSFGGPRLVQGVAGAAILALAAWYFLGSNPPDQPSGSEPGGGNAGGAEPAPGLATDSAVMDKDPEVNFVTRVLADSEDTWGQIFSNTTVPDAVSPGTGTPGTRPAYKPPKLALFSGAVSSACGFQEVAMGPFYCPGERQVYIDLDFIRELRQRFAMAGDYAAAYVIAHEMGHHVQNLLGTTRMAQQMLEPATEEEVGETSPPDAEEIPPVDATEITLMVELQADCYAGMWAQHAGSARDLLERGDVQEALAAASTLGNDLLQQKARGYVMPDSFTHGTAEQRLRWFRTGLTSGDVESCETFASPEL